jgi:hypothetical protein
MPKMIATHSVVDIDRWLDGQAERAAGIGKYATDVTDYVAVDGRNNVAITADVHDLAGLQALMTSPSPEDVAEEERHGVIQPITAYIEK